MASKTEIWNMSMGHLGIGKQITSPTEQSAEAQACRVFWDTCLAATQEDFPLPLTRKVAVLNLVGEDPDDDWAYSYRYPVDCVRIRRIITGDPYGDRQSRVDYEIGSDSQGRLVYTDQENAEIVYSALNTDPSQWPASLVLAISYRLASLVASRLTQGDPFKLGEKAYVMYQNEITNSQANQVNEEQNDEEPDSEFIRTRN
jgi:hypothetical protein